MEEKQMEKHISGLLVVIAAAFLLVGGLVGYNIGEAEIETKTITEIEYQNVSVDRIVEVQAPSELDRAVAEFLKSVEDEEVEDVNGTEVDVLGNYNFDELEVSRVYEDYSVSYEDDLTTVNFSIKIRLNDGDDRARETYDVTVILEEDEDTEVIVA